MHSSPAVLWQVPQALKVVVCKHVFLYVDTKLLSEILQSASHLATMGCALGKASIPLFVVPGPSLRTHFNFGLVVSRTALKDRQRRFRGHRIRKRTAGGRYPVVL